MSRTEPDFQPQPHQFLIGTALKQSRPANVTTAVAQHSFMSQTKRTHARHTPADRTWMHSAMCSSSCSCINPSWYPESSSSSDDPALATGCRPACAAARPKASPAGPSPTTITLLLARQYPASLAVVWPALVHFLALEDQPDVCTAQPHGSTCLGCGLCPDPLERPALCS